LTKSNQGSGAGKALWIIEGTITEEFSIELEAEYGRLPPGERSDLCVYLNHVPYADEKGLDLLSRMAKDGVKLKEAGLLVRELLRARIQDS
jgi:hypothetical protein